MWNELEGCKIDVPKIPFDSFDEVYAVDGGSTDGSVEYLESKGIPVYKQPVKGLNAAYIHARNKSSTDAVVVFFPKGTIDPLSLTEFIPYLREGNDLVIASRNIKGAFNEEDNHIIKPRKWAVNILSLLASIIWKREGKRMKDVLHGVKAFTNSSFDKMNILDNGLSIDIEMVIRSYKLKLKRAEFPVIEKPRQYGDTHFSAIRTGIKLLKYLKYELTRS